MFGLVHLVVSAEREGRRNHVARMDDRPEVEAQVWLWRHMAFLLVAGVLTLFILGGKAF